MLEDTSVPNFANSVDVAETDAGVAISPQHTPDFSNSSDVVDTPPPADIKRSSVISKVARFLTSGTSIEKMQSMAYLANNNLIPDPIEGENVFDYTKRLNQALESREEEITGEGVGRVLSGQMDTALLVGAGAAPIATSVFLGIYNQVDKFINLRRFTDKNFPTTAPEVKDIIEIGDFLLKGAAIGGGMLKGKEIIKGFDKLGIPKNANISSEQVGKISDSVNLLPEEKSDLMATLGIEQKHVDASVNSGMPINVTSEKILDLAEKPYWERAKAEMETLPAKQEIVQLGADLKGEAAPKEGQLQITQAGRVEGDGFVAYPADKAGKAIARAYYDSYVQPLLNNIKSLQKEKNLSGMTVKALKDYLDIENIKKADIPQLKKLESFLNDLKKNDSFVSEKTLEGLKDIVKELPAPEITPKRIIIEKFGDKEEIMQGAVVGKIDNRLIPTVDIKEGHPLIKKIVEDAGRKLDKAHNEVVRRDEQLNTMLTKAEKSRVDSLPLQEKISRKLVPQNKEIFEALSGNRVELTKEEAGVVAYLKNFFNMARKDLALEKYRKNYVTHLEKDFTEKVLNDGVISAVRDMLTGQKQGDIPVNIMLELDNIIGSEKFFKYALERKGGIDPTTNIRRIVSQYSNLYETKKALDQILPEGQAVTKNLLQGKSAVWMKQFLQNLKGRGLDNQFRTGKMGWLAKTADAIIDVGYVKLLGLNWKSALKNIVAGETNSWIYQDFPSYLEGKKRFYSNPKKAYKLATEYGILEGTYADYAEKGIGKLKKLQDFTMIGQRGGEVEIRGSIFTSMLTDKEWKTGEISPENIQKIKDTVAITQGVFSKVDSPLMLQTWYGRMFFQMNRWRITNAMLLRRIANDASADIKSGNYKTQNTTRLGKMLVAYGTGMYISYQLAQAGYRTASDVARNMAQTIDGVTSLVTEGQLVRMFTDNPTLSVLKEAAFSTQELANYLHVPGAKSPKTIEMNQGIEDTYIAPLKNIEEITQE